MTRIQEFFRIAAIQASHSLHAAWRAFFEKVGDFEAFERVFVEAAPRTDIRLLSYCLMHAAIDGTVNVSPKGQRPRLVASHEPIPIDDSCQ